MCCNHLVYCGDFLLFPCQSSVRLLPSLPICTRSDPPPSTPTHYNRLLGYHVREYIWLKWVNARGMKIRPVSDSILGFRATKKIGGGGQKTFWQAFNSICKHLTFRPEIMKRQIRADLFDVSSRVQKERCCRHMLWGHMAIIFPPRPRIWTPEKKKKKLQKLKVCTRDYWSRETWNRSRSRLDSIKNF